MLSLCDSVQVHVIQTIYVGYMYVKSFGMIGARVIPRFVHTTIIPWQ